jgi:hypothetical protein
MTLHDYLKKKGFEKLLDAPFMNPSHAGSSQTYEELFEGYLEAQEPKTFDEAARPLMKWLCENHHPHITAIVTGTSNELLEGLESNPDVFDYIVD